MMRLRGNPVVVGERVRISTAHLRSTCQYMGPEAPTSYGPFARGELVRFDGYFAVVLWDDGTERRIHPANLERENAPVL